MGLLRRRPKPPSAPNEATAAGLDDTAPGWDAIDAACEALYATQEPRHVGYSPPAAFSTNLQGCSAYRAHGHWHYVSYGLSELYQPGPDDDPKFSGWGFELTLRLVARDESEAPGWPFTMLNELAKYANSESVLLSAGSRIDLRAPITGHPHVPDAPATGLTVWALTPDPELGTISTPNGAVEFLQVVGVSAAEKATMVSSSTATVLAAIAVGNPLLITDPARG